MTDYSDFQMEFNTRSFFQDCNITKLFVYLCLLVFTVLFALKEDQSISIPYWLVFSPLWLWKGVALAAGITGIVVHCRHPPARTEVQSELEFRHMLLGFGEVILLLIFEVLVVYKLDGQSDLYWVIIFTPPLFECLMSVVICIWSAKNDKNIEFELFFSVNILQFVFLALKLDKFVNWHWVIVFVPLWILICVSLIGVLYAVVLAILFIRSLDLLPEHRRQHVFTAISYTFLVVPMLIFLILLTNKLDGDSDLPFLMVCTPLYVSLLCLMFMACGTRGGNSWWFGIRRDFCHFLLDVCPLVRLYGNNSYKCAQMSTGLTTQAAFRQLQCDLRESLTIWRSKLSSQLGWKQLLRHAVSHGSNANSPYCWAFLLFQLLTIGGFLLSAWQSQPDRNVLGSAMVLTILMLINLVVSAKLYQLRRTELLRKGQQVAAELLEIVETENLAEIATFDLYSPASECVSLQWTYRDGQLVNLPTLMLVRHDIILLRPGREAPCSCRLVDPTLPPMEIVGGQQYFRQLEYSSSDELGNYGTKPVSPVRCELVETPARLFFENCQAAQLRNASVFENEVREVLHTYGERLAIPTLLVLTVVVGTFRHFYQPETSGSFYDAVVLPAATVLLALSSFTHLAYLTLLSLYCSSRVVHVFLSGMGRAVEFSKRSTETIEMFTDTQDVTNSNKSVEKISVWKVFRRLLFGDPKYLTYSANIVQTLGNVTNLSIVDKKGILSWPNPTPEKLFFIHHPYERGMGTSESEKSRIRPSSSGSDSDGSSDESEVGEDNNDKQQLNSKLDKLCHGGDSQSDPVAEVLDFTHDPNRAFSVHFDDHKWSRHLNSLKPIGLNIFLNSCQFQPVYTRFLDHLHVVSELVPRTIAVVNRRCLCALAEVIGFKAAAKSSFHDDPKILCCYRRTPGELPLPGLTKHRTPLPNMFSLIVRDKAGGKLQCLSQGTADLMLDACQYYWDGKDVKRLTKQYRKKILDFYHRYSMTTYCLGFSYSPVNIQLANGLDQTFFEWPTADMAHLMTRPIDNNFDLTDPSVLREVGLSLDSLLADDFFPQHDVFTPTECLTFTHRNHIFLGLIALQYQAKPDVVRMVEQLDRACIRFVHFSKENELRSRVFAEKMGLEAGWNCHISLSSEGSTDDLCIGGVNWDRKNSYKSLLRNSTCAVGKKNETSPRRCESVPSQLKYDLPVVHFKCSPEPNESQKRFAPLANTSSLDSVFSVDEGDEESDMETLKLLDSVDVNNVPISRSLAREPTSMLIAVDSHSHTSIVTSGSNSTGGFNTQRFCPQFTSGLPKGIENVRPHLRNVDNVPLLVPLFTDTNSTATCEMIKILQEWGEVVCVGGSSANHLNAEVFLQADCAVGIEPLQPAICVNEETKSTGVGEKKPLDCMKIVNLLASLPCSLSISAGQHISMLQLIAQSRHLLKLMRNSLVFLLQTSFAVAFAQLISLLTFMPPIFSPGLCLWLVCLTFPLLSASLCAKPYNPSALKLATSKNELWIRRADLLGYLLGFGVKFLPSVIVVVINFRLCLHSFCSQLHSLDVNISHHCGVVEVGSNRSEPHSWNGWKGSLQSGLVLAENVSGIMLVLFVAVISVSFVNQRSSIWTRSPLCNLTWVATAIGVILAQLIYAAVDLSIPISNSNAPLRVDFAAAQLPYQTYLIAVIWPIAGILPSVELLKFQEIRWFNRDQRRRRLAFTTKLGMNSPFG